MSDTVYTEFPGDEIIAVHFKPEKPKPPDRDPGEACGSIETPNGPQIVNGYPEWHWNCIATLESNFVYFTDPSWVPEADQIAGLENFWFLDDAVAFSIEWVVGLETKHTNPVGAPINTITVPYQTGLQLTPATVPGPVGTPGRYPEGGPLVTGPNITFHFDLRDYDDVPQTLWLSALFDFTAIDIHSTPAPPEGWDNNVLWTTSNSFLRITPLCLHDDGRKPPRAWIGPMMRMRRQFAHG